MANRKTRRPNQDHPSQVKTKSDPKTRSKATDTLVRPTSFADSSTTLPAQIGNISVYTFNANLILPKPRRNGLPLPCSQWGGTDPDRRTRARDGVRVLRFSGKVFTRSLSLHVRCPAQTAAPKFFLKAPPSTCHGRLFPPSHGHSQTLDSLLSGRTTQRLRLPGCVDDAVR